MPELPEVEVTRLSLVDRVDGAQIVTLQLGKPLRWPLGVPPERVAGQRIGRLVRRGKYLWMPLFHSHAEAGGLLWHLGMSGSLRFGADLPPRATHDHVELLTDRGTLRLTDPRRFGALVWSPSLRDGPAATLLARLGVEPLETGFTPSVLHAGFEGRRVAVKQALLAGDVVVGVGNIYCSEALFAAGIDPRLPAQRLSRPRCERLALAIQQVLRRAVAMGGTTLRDFHDAHGAGGAFQDETQVYDRAGQPCRRCAAPIRRLVQGQRATYFCPVCQRR
jgi:formamidopyrimidine-DNA glycosylase